MTRSVAVAVRPGVMPLELGIVHQLFGAAVDDRGERLYEVRTCAVTPGSVATDADFAIAVDHGVEWVSRADTVVVPASHAVDSVDFGAPLSTELAACLARIRSDARIASICTGAFVLAAAGLLDGLHATTHWKSCAAFRQRFPAVELRPEVLYTDNGRILTSAGEASGIDLCLHLIRRDHGAAVANAVARTTVVAPHRPGGQAQYIPRPVVEAHSPSTVRARAWVLEHLDQPVSLTMAAAVESMSVRTFTRRFRTEVGTTFVQWLTDQRVRLAMELLEGTDLSIEDIADRCGFGSAASFRAHLQESIGVSPSRYRATFRN